MTLEELQVEVKDLQDEIEVITKKPKYLFIADSYDLYSGWIGKTATKLGLASNEYWNLGLSGSSFVDGRWLSQLQGWVNTHPNDIADIQYIVCGGGINDSSQYYVYLPSAMQSFSAYVRSVFNADTKIKLAYFGWALDTSIILCGRTADYRRITMTIYSKCIEYGMEYVTGCETVLHDRTVLDADGLHPNQEGGNRIATGMATALMTGNNIVVNSGNANIVPVGGSVNGVIKQTLYNGMNTVIFDNFGIAGCNFRFQNGSYVAIANVKLPYGNTIPPQMCQVMLHQSGGATKLYNCRFKIENEVMSFSLYDINPATAWLCDITCDNINQFSLTITFPAMTD